MGKARRRAILGGMKILLALGETQRHDIAAAAARLAEIATEHELIVVHDHPVPVGHALEVALRNALPERDVVSVLTQVVVAPEISSLEPHAIAEIRSLRFLLDRGALVICAGRNAIPVALDGLGSMHELEASVDPDLVAALLARRLDADLLMMLTDPLQDSGTREAKAVAARRFVAATGKRAAVGSLAEIAGVVRGDTLAA